MKANNIVICSALLLAFASGSALAADHVDSPSVIAEPSADITDVYAWVNGNKVVLVMNVSPFATDATQFSDAVTYVLHASSGPAYGNVSGDFRIVVQFDADEKASVWYGSDGYLKGDARQSAGLSSDDGKFKIFTGLKTDPFFFNLDGFHATVAAVEGAAPGLTFDTAGCPALDGPTATALQTLLATNPLSVPPGGPALNFFADKKLLSIVVELDKNLLAPNGAIAGIWASTHARVN
jgi:hypothetical protein